jgi:hypothetical protein
MTTRVDARFAEAGVALICTLMVTALLATLATVIVLLVTTESLISANHRHSHEALYAAEAGIERTDAELRALADWRSLPGSTGAAASAFQDGSSSPRLADGTTIDLPRLTAERQSDSNGMYGTGPNHPVWQLYGHGPLSMLLPAGSITSHAYVVIWIADDGDERDGNPLSDSNDAVLVRAEAFGIRGARRRIEATLARGRPGVIVWREVH